MENEVVLLDTSVLIDYYRKTNKDNTFFFRLINENYSFAVSAITYFEIFTGATDDQTLFWDAFFFNIIVLPFDKEVSKVASVLNQQLKRSRKQIELPDLFIAATAISNGIGCATLNNKHFERIENLKLIVK